MCSARDLEKVSRCSLVFSNEREVIAQMFSEVLQLPEEQVLAWDEFSTIYFMVFISYQVNGGGPTQFRTGLSRY